MPDFICRDPNTQSTLASWKPTILTDDLSRCTQIILEKRKRDNLPVANRRAGEAAVLNGLWYESSQKLIETMNSAPDLKPDVETNPFPDRHSHEYVHNSWVQRADFINGLLQQMDVDDKDKFQQKLFRDISGAIRALVGDVIDLQERLGEVMMRVDNLEQWNMMGGDSNIHDLPGNSILENDSQEGLPDLPYFIGKSLISNETQQKLYHQGNSVNGVDGGLRRYYSAQESRGIGAPLVSPRAVADPRTGIQERYDQGAIAPDGGLVCFEGEYRVGFGDRARCESEPGQLLEDFPAPVVESVPVFRTSVYKPKLFGTSHCVLPTVLQKVLGGLDKGYVSNSDGEIYNNVYNPVCIPHGGSLSYLPKCLKPARQINAFTPMPPLPLSTPPCKDGDTELLPGTCPNGGAIS